MAKVAHIEEKYFQYEFIEQRLIALKGVNSSALPRAFSRCFFGPNNSLTGKRIVGISIAAPFPVGFFWDHRGRYAIPQYSALRFLTMTIVNKKGIEQVKNFPLHDLDGRSNSGHTRIFDIEVDRNSMEASYLMPVANVFAFIGNPAFLINFYTVNW